MGRAKTKEAIEEVRVPPYNLQAEMTVLGACLGYPEAIADVAPLLQPDDFFQIRHGMIWAAMTDLWQRGETVNLIMVTEGLRRQGNLEEVGGRSFLAALIDAVPTAASVKHYARLIREKAQRRAVLACLGQALAEGYRDSRPLLEEVADLQSALLQTLGEWGLSRTLRPQEFADLLRTQPAVSGLTTGLPVIDDTLGGLTPGHLIVVAGRPRMGKTTLLLQWADHLALDEQRPILFCSIEQSAHEIGGRLFVRRTRESINLLRTPDDARVTGFLSTLSESGFHIDDRAALRLADLTAIIRAWVTTEHVQAVFVDHLGKIVPPRGETRTLEIGTIVRSLKDLAKSLHLPVIAACQLNRAVEGRNNPRPLLADLRECGEIEQEADAVVFLWSPTTDQHERMTKAILPMCVTIAKNRHGPEAEAEIDFHRAYFRFGPAQTTKGR